MMFFSTKTVSIVSYIFFPSINQLINNYVKNKKNNIQNIDFLHKTYLNG